MIEKVEEGRANGDSCNSSCLFSPKKTLMTLIRALLLWGLQLHRGKKVKAEG